MKRKPNGYALISTLIIGVSSIAFLMALAQFLTTANANQALQRQRMELRAAAEAGMDYAVTSLNKALHDNDLTQLDPPIYTLPPGYLTAQSGTVKNNGDRVTVTIKVTRLPNSDSFKTWCSVFDAQLAPITNGPSSELRYQQDYWRMVESTATFQSGLSKTVRCLLRPESSWWGSSTSSLPDPPVIATPRSYFSQGMVANSTFKFAPPSTAAPEFDLVVKQYESSNVFKLANSNGVDYADYRLNLVSNGDGAFVGRTDVQGNVQSIGNGLTSADNSRIDGRLTSGGTDPNQGWNDSPGASPNTTGTPPDNVLANADIIDSSLGTGTDRLGLNNSNPQLDQQTMKQSEIPAPTAPPGSQNLPSLKQVSQLTNPIIMPGTYTTVSLSTADVTTPVTIDSSVTVDNPVRVFLDDSTLSSSSAISISTDKFQTNTGDPRNVQIWYQGTRDINIELADGKSFQGLIYAPNAKVTTTNKSGSTSGIFDGAIVANEVNVLHSGEMNLMTSLSELNTSNGTAAADNIRNGLRVYTDDTDPTKSYLYPWTYEAITYQEY